MPVDEKKFLHARIPEPQAAQMRALAKHNCRKIGQEMLIAVDDHLSNPDTAALIDKWQAEQREALRRGKKMPKGKSK